MSFSVATSTPGPTDIEPVEPGPGVRSAVRSPAARRAEIAAVFDRVADDYDQVGVAWFTPMAQRLVNLLAPAPGDRALDIGCGRGAAVFELAERVGASGSVAGIDISPRMIELTARDPRCTRPGAAPVRLTVDDAARPVSIPARSVDVIASSFVLFFLPAPAAALRAWRELLSPGGRVGVTTFAQHRGGWLQDVLDDFVPARVSTAASPSPFDSAEGMDALFTGAGLVGVSTVSIDLELVFDDLRQWHAWSWSHGQRAVWERIALADRGPAVAAVADHLHRFRRPDGRIVLTESVRCTIGSRAPQS